MMSPAPAGAGAPVKNGAAYESASWDASVLKRARRSAQHTAKSSAIAQPKPCSSDNVHKYRTAAGATPKLTKSDKLSSSAPKLDVALSRRAMRPSSPSKMPAAMIENTAATKFPPIAKRIAVIPAQSASSVRTFGTMRLTDMPESRRARIRDRRPLAERILKILFPSLRHTLARRLLREPVGEHAFAADHPLPRRHHRDISRRAINVDSRAEADDADPLTGRDFLAFVEVTNDTS